MRQHLHFLVTLVAISTVTAWPPVWELYRHQGGRVARDDKTLNCRGGREERCKEFCGDGIVQPPEECDFGKDNGKPNIPCDINCRKIVISRCGNGILEPGEECDLGPINGAPGSLCSKNCTKLSPPRFCGNGIVEPDLKEECDLGVNNGKPGFNCTADCKLLPPIKCCGNGKLDPGEECDLGPNNGKPGFNCTTDCKLLPPIKCCGNGIVEVGEECDEGQDNGKPGHRCRTNCTLGPEIVDPPVCATCDPNPYFNKCDITASCTFYPTNGKHYCACRAGYRADALAPTDARQFRLPWLGQEYRVFVAPGVACNTLCTTPFPGPDSCKEVPVKAC